MSETETRDAIDIAIGEVSAAPEIDEADKAEYTERLYRDFCFFAVELWHDRKYDRFAALGEMELDICRWVAECGSAHRGVLAPRGVGKSYFGAAAYSAWRLFRDPETKILVVSKSKIPHARDTARLIRGWLTNVWFLRHLNPRDSVSEFGTDQTFQFDVNGSTDGRYPSVLAQGIDGQITGSRAHVVIADDIETPSNTKTTAARMELDGAVAEFADIAKFGQREIVYFGTYHHEESLYLKLAARKYAFRTWPFTYPLEGEKFLNLAPIIERNMQSGKGKPGQPTFSHRYTMDHVIENQAEGRTHWLMQYQLVSNLASTNRYPIRLSDLIVFPVQRDKAPVTIAYGRTNDRGGSTAIEMQIVGFDGDALHAPIMFDREWAPYSGTKAWVDPAGKGQDLTGVAIVGHLSGMLWVKGVYGFPGGASSERLDEIAKVLRDHGAKDVYVETNIDVFDSYAPLLEEAMHRHFLEPGENPAFPDGWKASLEKRHSTGQKEVRIIDTLEPVISSHRLVIHPDALRPDPTRKLDHELQRMFAAITRERNCLPEDGPIDALAGAVAEWQHILRMNPGKAAVATKGRVIDALVKEHFRLTGRKVPEARWFNNR